MFSKSKEPPAALAVYFPPAVYTPGSTIEGEVELNFRQLREDNIDEVHVKLRGLAYTCINQDKVTLEERVELAHDQISLWTRGGAYPNPGTDVLRLPFRFVLPADALPPSFKFQSSWQWAHVKYSVCAVGARKGRLTPNRRHRVPFPVLPIDEAGTSVRQAAATDGWQRLEKEESIRRRGLWGDYSKVKVELALPDIPVLPLFSDIPYTITVTTTGPPLAHEKADTDKGKGSFPPLPRDPHELEFELQQRLQLRAGVFNGKEGRASSTVATILGGKKEKSKRAQVAVDVELPEREWAPAHASLVADDKEKGKEKASVHEEGKGSWVQRVAFRSTFRLNCPPAFAVKNIECNYVLVVRVPFPGIGNSLKLEIPVTVTSGIDKPLAQSSTAENDPPILDLPPAYWDPDGNNWDGDEKD
uniref:Structural maintenance of chromosomes protein n=1 Tax=Ganoderma boninense TaxID=34458 RepID=A0A5K1K2U9_9APHY|nr:Structural maintenance of chromosomes protein [Ganoderma boninense]